MTGFRFPMAVLLFVWLGWPLVFSAGKALLAADSFPLRAADGLRIAGLLANSAGLTVGAVLIAVPLGTAAAVALERFAVPGRRFLRAMVVVGLFVPVPVYAVAWQVVLGNWLQPLAMEPGAVAWRSWTLGLLPAAWVHGMAAVPWVVWIVGAVLRTSDRALEEVALQEGGPAAVLRRVLFPRVAVAVVASAGWVAVLTATEIAVTDAMMVRTFAEEVYTQFVGASDGLAGALAATVPVWIGAALLLFLVVRPVLRLYGEPSDGGEPSGPLPATKPWNAAAGVLAWIGFVLTLGLPVAALAWQTAGGATSAGPAVEFLFAEMAKVLRTDGGNLVGSAGAALAAGVIAAGLAWAACRIARDSPTFARFLLGLCVFLWVAPGPVVGIAIKDAIAALMNGEARLHERVGAGNSRLISATLLYDSPSPLPAVWAAVIRFFPVAVAVIWPAIRAVPRELTEAAWLDGLGVVRELRRVYLPLTGAAAARAAVAVAALALGEVGATKLADPPGRTPFVLQLFAQMHYGAETTVAALALLQVASVATFALLLPGRQSHPPPRE